MGEKGARQSAEGAERAAMLVESLEPLGPVTSRTMFGGHGIFLDGTMFALVDTRGAAYLRADDATAPDFEAAGSERHGRMPYWRIPDAVLQDPDQLLAWGGRAGEVARAAKG
ncbi:TfoX/Sxy family protein [Nocardioides sp. GCM10027113]|uniref:TfoX/Sxy family protein n=1 Tax=unclassified Nocardioides TaxID=2615069 RepID=UPI00360820DF